MTIINTTEHDALNNQDGSIPVDDEHSNRVSSSEQIGVIGGADEELQVVSGEARANARTRCRIIRMMTSEMFALICERRHMGRDSRRYLTHTRHIAMYVCHVSLGLPMFIVAAGFGFDRTTVSYACQSVESRRDDPDYNEFVTAVERVAKSIFGSTGGRHGQ